MKIECFYLDSVKKCFLGVVMRSWVMEVSHRQLEKVMEFQVEIFSIAKIMECLCH